MNQILIGILGLLGNSIIRAINQEREKEEEAKKKEKKQ